MVVWHSHNIDTCETSRGMPLFGIEGRCQLRRTGARGKRRSYMIERECSALIQPCSIAVGTKRSVSYLPHF